ncbi:protein tyrosine kinase [Dictyocaulus viviparus]|uniref:Protein tyrosine kinase n=1 Tax=Dictyocaulus viviparus TaxID=29172 RepID=A0A0D8XE54_DICVI|nr:protein tyrosine kinase [Dictyocaulus viviparus]
MTTDCFVKKAVFSLSSKSASPKLGLATWNDFHFPPPPSIPDDKIYAHMNFTLPLRKEADYRKSTVERLTQYDDNHLYDAIPFTEQSEKQIRIVSSSLKMGNELGKGKHTIVRECFAPNLGKVAHKSIRDKRNVYGRKALFDEMKALCSTNNAHVISLLSVDDNNGLLLELARNGNIKQYLTSHRYPLPISTLLGFCADICEGMRHLESLGVVHGHLSPNNVVLDAKMRAKVTSPRGTSHHAQLRYSSPESIIQNSFSSHSDVWAFAVCCWEIVENQCQKIPYESLTNCEVVENARRLLNGQNEAIVLQFTESIPRGIRDVLLRCFEVEPNARPLFAHISYFMSKYYVSLD